MLRFMRLDREALAPQTIDAVMGMSSLLDTINAPDNARNLIALAEADGTKFNFSTVYSGSISTVFSVNGQPQFSEAQKDAAAHYAAQREALTAALNSHYPEGSESVLPQNDQVLSSIDLLRLLLKYPQHVAVIDDRYPVIVPAMESSYYSSMLGAARELQAAAAAAAAVPQTAPSEPVAPAPAAAPAAAGTAGAAAGGLTGCLIAALTGLLLLLIALGIYFWLFWPWPFYEDNALSPADELAALEQKLAHDEAVLLKINDMLEKTEAMIAFAQEDSRLNNLDAQLAKLDNDLQKRDEIEKLLTSTQGLIAAAEKTEKNYIKDQKKSPATAATFNGKPLQKCETIIRQGKVPHLLIATDGSGSMIKPLNDGTMRITAAIKAANALVDKVDKNVPVRLFGIQGCPLARDYGIFSGSERARLKQAIAQTSPINVRGMLPIEVLTPLISGLTGMVNSAPKDVESTGILISDGVDTCKGTEDQDICVVARKLHKTRPKLKIHVILIGEDAPDARCVADITGGKVYRPGNTDKLISDLKNAGKTLEKVCY